MKAHTQVAAAVTESQGRAEVPKDAGLQVLNNDLELKDFCPVHCTAPSPSLQLDPRSK